jgi:hypothetical protein
MKAQMPPSTATLTDNGSNSVMAVPIDLMLRGPRIHLESFIAVFLGIAPLVKPGPRNGALWPPLGVFGGGGPRNGPWGAFRGWPSPASPRVQRRASRLIAVDTVIAVNGIF